MWLMDSKTKKLIFIKCDYDKFILGLKQVYNLKYISKTELKETFIN
jgi:hypothetical protein